MSALSVTLPAILGLVLGMLAIAGGVVLLVVGSRRHDDSTSRAPLAFGVVALVIGTAIAVPTLLSLALALVGVR